MFGRQILISVLFSTLMASAAYAQDFTQYVGQREEGCGEGTEIKVYQGVKAPLGRYFSDYSFRPEGPILNHASKAGQVGCTVLSTDVSKGYTTGAHLLAHADCGHTGGPTIQAYCKFSAKLGALP